MKPTDPKPKSDEFNILREIVRKNGVDAWDLGFQGQLSPGSIDEAVQSYLDSLGFAGAKKLIEPIKKRGR